MAHPGRAPILRAMMVYAVIPATSATVVVIATFIPLRAWAHHLTDSQRNGGAVGYGLLFLAWSGVAALALILWTSVAVAAGRRVVLSRRLLAAEAGPGRRGSRRHGRDPRCHRFLVGRPD